MEQMDVDMEVEAVASLTIADTSAAGGSNSSNPNPNVMAGPSAVPSAAISLHPLVIMNIAEHWTRIRAQLGEVNCTVYGALIGKQEGRNIEVMNSFELKMHTVGNDVFVNLEYYNEKKQQFKQVFSELDFIGWYTTGEAPTEQDIKLQKQIAELNECPIMLQLDPLSRSVEQLPLKLYESVIDMIGGEATMRFVPLTYTLATEEAERIGLDHVARIATNETGDKSVVAEHLVATQSAVKMLNDHVKILLKYVQDVEAGILEPNHEILRDIYAICHRLPVMQGKDFEEAFYTQCNDVSLIIYLATLTKGCNALNQFIGKFNRLNDRQAATALKGRRLRLRGLNY